MPTPKYFKIEELINLIDEPNRSACFRILNENRKLFETVRGSTHNHQTWDGGILDYHYVENIMNLCNVSLKSYLVNLN